MHATITDKAGEYGVEIGTGQDVIIPWTSFKTYEETNHTICDVILLLGFDVVGTWSRRNNVSRALVRSVTTPPAPKPKKPSHEKHQPLDSPAPEETTFLE